MENNVPKIRKIESYSEFIYLPLGSVIKVIWHKSDWHEKDSESFGVIYGDKIGWEDGSNDDIQTLIVDMNDDCCDVYLTDDKVLALEHLYQACMDYIEDIQSSNAEEISDRCYGAILAFTDMEHKIMELLHPEMH